jgi:hypothetical protein
MHPTSPLQTAGPAPQNGPPTKKTGSNGQIRQQPALFFRQHFRMKFGDLLISFEQG